MAQAHFVEYISGRRAKKLKAQHLDSSLIRPRNSDCGDCISELVGSSPPPLPDVMTSFSFVFQRLVLMPQAASLPRDTHPHSSFSRVFRCSLCPTSVREPQWARGRPAF